MSHHVLLSLFIVLSFHAYSQLPRIIQSNSQRDIIPEGIAIDPRSGKMFVSSINRHKIVIVDTSGAARDFIAERQDGFLEGLGMKVDTARKLLWALSVQKDNNRHHSKVHAFNIETGNTVKQFELNDTANHLLNDLVLMENGDVFITDTYYGAVYRIDAGRKNLQLFSQHRLLRYPNGIEKLDANRLVVATYSNGLVVLNTVTNEVQKLAGAKDSLIIKGLDGLLRNGNSLYGVYNAAESQEQNAIVEYTLDPGLGSIVSEKIIDRGNKLFHDPTTAAYFKQQLYVIANSHLTEYNNNKTSTAGIENQLSPISLLVYGINNTGISIKGIYGHPGEFWKKGYDLRDLNVNAVFLHHKSIDTAFMRRARSEGLNIYAEFATLNGEGYVEKNPGAWAVDHTGANVKKATWFMGVCPTDPKFRDHRLSELRNVLNKYDIDGVWLDYLHWHAQFEDPEPILPETSTLR